MILSETAKIQQLFPNSALLNLRLSVSQVRFGQLQLKVQVRGLFAFNEKLNLNLR
jgi:hypothetical protein